MPALREIYVADDHEAVRLGVTGTLTSNRYRVSAQCRDHDELWERLEDHVPDAVVTDYAMPGTMFEDGLGYLARLARAHPAMRILVLTAARRPVVLQAMRECGVHGLLDKRASLQAIPIALRCVLAGRFYRSGTFEGTLDASALSPAQREVLQLLGLGRSLSQVAQETGRAFSTVTTLKQRAMATLGIERHSDLHDYAIGMSADMGAPH